MGRPPAHFLPIRILPQSSAAKKHTTKRRRTTNGTCALYSFGLVVNAGGCSVYNPAERLNGAASRRTNRFPLICPHEAPETLSRDDLAEVLDDLNKTLCSRVNGAAFSEAILRTVFGYAPRVGSEVGLWSPHASRGLAATLSGLRLPNGTLASVCSKASGVSFCGGP